MKNIGNLPELPPELQGIAKLTTLEQIYAWARRRSLWPMFFGLACCAFEMIATAASRYDLGRFGMEIMRASPRQADLLIVTGTVTKKMAPQVVRLYNQMAEPKYVIAMGACAISGGPFKEGYNVVSGIDKLIPVDVYIPGCPPRPEGLLHAILTLHAKIEHEPIGAMRAFNKKPGTAIQSLEAQRPYDVSDAEGILVPSLGPDLVDHRAIEAFVKPSAPDMDPEASEESPATTAAQSIAKTQKTSTPPKAGPSNKPLAETLRQREAWSEITAPLAGVPDDARQALATQFSDRLHPAQSIGQCLYEGLVLSPKDLIEVAHFLWDTLDFSYLSHITAVDHPEPEADMSPYIDVVYHFFRLTGTGQQPDPRATYLCLHVLTDRDNPSVPSLTPDFPSATFQEREVWDLFGVHFKGHPDLRRLLMWEGFDGFPMRKDWHEPYYEEEHKPLSSRYPYGDQPIAAESRTPLKGNLHLPKTWGTQIWDFHTADRRLYNRMLSADQHPDKPLPTDEMILNMGPHHPSTHGVFRMAVRLDGETIQHLEPVFGYLHRNHEKIGERNTWLQNIPFTDRLDYINGMTNNLAYVIALEKLLEWDVPERAEYIRVIMSEFSRIINHMIAAGFFGNDVGYYVTAALYAMEERELILDLFEAASGGRMLFNYMRPGGVAVDLPDGWIEQAKVLVNERLPPKIARMQTLLLENEIVRARAIGVGKLSPEQAIAYGTSGPVLRASGISYDIRRADPYSIYDRFDFDVVTGEYGDAFDRVSVRFGEIWQSLRILRQALAQIPSSGPIKLYRLSPRLKIPKGEIYSRIEAPKGELGFYLVSTGGPNPYRYHIRSPSLINLTTLSELCRDSKIADVVTILGSIDLTMGEVDR
jgi:NADH-quinone oxidoreductase subunit B/C/D